NPRWAAFKEDDFLKASHSGYSEEDDPVLNNHDEIKVEVARGDFDLRGFEVARLELFDNQRRAYAKFTDKSIKFSAACTNKLADKNHIELLVNPLTRQFAIRTTDKDNRQSVVCS
ncbi:MAG: recombinase family protein, partial [Clostridia bacterium]|nr:recombinase family protein [Clostridia bacterium]